MNVLKSSSSRVKPLYAMYFGGIVVLRSLRSFKRGLMPVLPLCCHYVTVQPSKNR